MANYKAALFDLDGTLLDTLDDLADSMNAALKHLDCPTHDVSAYKYFVGDGLDRLVQRVLPKKKLHLASQCTNAMLSEYHRRWADKTKPYKNIPELLSSLSEKNITLTILSNKPHEFTCKTVSRFLSQWSFKKIYGARPDVPKKPDPSGAIIITEELGIPADQFLYLGDTNTDMQTAKDAGMFPVGVLWGFRQADELQAAGAKLLLNDPLELLNLL